MGRLLIEAVGRHVGAAVPEARSTRIESSFFRQGQKPPDYASHFLGPNPDYLADGVSLEDETVKLPGSEPLPFLEAVHLAMKGRGALQTNGVYHSPKLGGDFKGAGAGLSPAYSYTTFVTEVTVDPQTGFIHVDRVTCAHDCGTQLNPLAVEGQIEGSIHMGLGQALMEGMVYEKGVLKNASFSNTNLAFEHLKSKSSASSQDNEGPFCEGVGEGALSAHHPIDCECSF